MENASLGSPTAPALVDPLTELTDASSDRFVSENPHAVIHERGKGSQTYAATALPAQSTKLTVYIACVPSGAFTVRVGAQWYSGHCAERFQNSGGFPVSPGDRPTVRLEISDKAQTWMVAVPEEQPQDR